MKKEIKKRHEKNVSSFFFFVKEKLTKLYEYYMRNIKDRFLSRCYIVSHN